MTNRIASKYVIVFRKKRSKLEIMPLEKQRIAVRA